MTKIEEIEYVYARSPNAKTKHIRDWRDITMCGHVAYTETQFSQQQNWRDPDRAQERIDAARALPVCGTCERAWEAMVGA